jgi:cytochrome P450
LQGDRIQLSIFGKDLFILADPTDVLHVLKENPSAYSKGRTTQMLKQFLGNGLITNEGESWRRQHRLIRPMMSLKSATDFGHKMDVRIEEFLNTLHLGSPVDSFHAMNLLTWRIVLNTLFSKETSPQMDKWLEDILAIMSFVTGRTRAIIKIPFWVPLREHRQVRRALKNFANFVFDLIKEREAMSTPPNDLLQLLLSIRDEEAQDSKMSHQMIKDEVLTFLMAGHETITNTLSWTLILLAQNPSYLKELRSEADAFFQHKDYSALLQAPWLGAVIDESMRLWPPVWAFMRLAEVPDKLGETVVPQKSNVVLSPYLTHRSPKLWDDPQAFRPERFLDKKKLKQGQFYPFGLGPRACIGAHFANVEARLILAHLVHRFDWKIENEAPQTFEAGITLRPTNNTTLIFQERKWK